MSALITHSTTPRTTVIGRYLYTLYAKFFLYFSIWTLCRELSFPHFHEFNFIHTPQRTQYINAVNVPLSVVKPQRCRLYINEKLTAHKTKIDWDVTCLSLLYNIIEYHVEAYIDFIGIAVLLIVVQLCPRLLIYLCCLLIVTCRKRTRSYTSTKFTQYHWTDTRRRRQRSIPHKYIHNIHTHTHS